MRAEHVDTWARTDTSVVRCFRAALAATEQSFLDQMGRIERVDFATDDVEERGQVRGSGRFVRARLIPRAIVGLVVRRTTRRLCFRDRLPHSEGGRVLVAVHEVRHVVPVRQRREAGAVGVVR